MTDARKLVYDPGDSLPFRASKTLMVRKLDRNRKIVRRGYPGLIPKINNAER
jgi:hypothetical protein